MPEAARRWVDAALGSPVVSAVTQVGGFSPGSAARLVTADHQRAFVKAVGDDVNAATPDLFRHEVRVLGALPPVPYRAGLIASYDDGTWVALLLDDVDGRHPDLLDNAEYDAVRTAVAHQSRELTPNPFAFDVPDLAATAARWTRTIVRTWDERPELFPAWMHEHRAALESRLRALDPRLPSESWVHLDIRDDNMLLRSDGSAVLLDWGMSRPGPSWVDEVMLALHHVESPRFDDEVARIQPSPTRVIVGDAREDLVTDWVLALGASLAAIADRPPPGLAGIGEFRRSESVRILAGVRRRLGV